MSDSGIDQNARTWGMICHLSLFAGYVVPCAGLAAPVVIWFIKKAESPFIDYHGREALNFLVSMVCYAIGITIFTLIPVIGLIGVLFWIALAILGIVLPIIAAIKANDGEHYRYPLIFRLL